MNIVKKYVQYRALAKKRQKERADTEWAVGRASDLRFARASYAAFTRQSLSGEQK